ncbi:vomeronasal type-1 receptor 4-like, partial [Sigmodon hispidus]
AIIIMPRNEKNIGFKARAPKIIGSSVSLCWTLQLMVNGLVPVLVKDKWDGGNYTEIRDFQYCVVVKPRNRMSILYGIFLALFDVMFFGIMMWGSGFMVLFLLKHKLKVQNIHRVFYPETRATQTILVL